MANGTVEALYPYSYEAGDGRIIAFSAGDRFTLLNKTNGDWWQVRKGSERPMYVPASYMKEISIPIYENIEFKFSRPHNGENVITAENGQSSESGENENESNGDSTAPDGNNHRNINRGTENTEENSQDACPISDESDGFGGVLSNAKLLAKSLEKVSFVKCDLSCLCVSITSYANQSGFLLPCYQSTILIAKEYRKLSACFV